MDSIYQLNLIRLQNEGPLYVGLLIWCACVAYFDWRTHRIPNWIVLLLLIPVALALWVNGVGMLGASREDCFIGATLGFVLFMPGYVIGAVGAGDVKLSAACGLLLGKSAMLLAISMTAALLIVVAAVLIRRHGWLAAKKMRFPAGVAIAGGVAIAMFVPAEFLSM